MTITRPIDKGGKFEEVLREYFLELGYFVVRGAKFLFDGSEVTDVDLWLCQRPSRFDRRRFNVDAKNRQSPKALERILWAKGLQVCLGLSGAIVATKDSRGTVKQFADENDVILLDGGFLSKLQARYVQQSTRIADEELYGLIRRGKSDYIGLEWVNRLDALKSRVLSRLDFDGCNSSLNDIRYFIEQIAIVPERRETAGRLLYFSVAVFLISIDYILKDYAFVERQSQIDTLNEGLRYGNFGKAGAEKVFSTAGKLVAAIKGEQADGKDLVRQLKAESMRLPVDILSEFLTKAGTNKSFFSLARSFEAAAYAVQFKTPAELDAESQSVLGVVLDFFGLERKPLYAHLVAIQPTQSGAVLEQPKDSGVATQLEIIPATDSKEHTKKTRSGRRR